MPSPASRPSMVTVALAAACVTLLGTLTLRGQQAAPPQPTRVAVVDLQEVFNNLDEKSAVEADITSQTEELSQEEQDRRSAIQSLQADLQILNEGSEAFRETKSDLERRVIEFQAWKEFKQRQLEAEKAIQIQALYRKVADACAAIANKQGYDLIVQKDTNVDTNARDQQQLTQLILQRKVLYSADELDVTDQVIQICNNRFNNRQGNAGN